MAEGYYSYRFQNPSAANFSPRLLDSRVDKTNELRAFDNLDNTFTPSFGKIGFSMAPEPAGFRIDLAFGPTADLGAPDLGSPGGEIFKHLLQAYASAKLFNMLTIDFGKFVTSAGAEVFENSNNWLFSRSMIFAYGPYTHSGVRLTLPINDVITLQGSISNGWDNIITAGSWKMFHLSTLFTLAGGNTSIIFNFCGGPQGTPDVRLLFDFVATQKVGAAFALNLNAIVGMEGTSKWFAGALMAKYTIAERVRLSARVEYFGDPDGHRTGQLGASYFNSTFGAGVILTNADAFGTVEIRPELRHDQQLSGGTVFAGGRSAAQTTAQVAMVARFAAQYSCLES